MCVKGECELWKAGLFSFCYPQNNLRASSSFGRLARLATKAFLKKLVRKQTFLFDPIFILCVNRPTCCKYFMPKLHPFWTSIYCGFKNFPHLTEALPAIQICIFPKGSSLFLHITCEIPDSSISTWLSETNAAAAKDCDLWHCVLCQSLLSDRKFIALPLQLTLTNNCCLLAVQEDWWSSALSPILFFLVFLAEKYSIRVHCSVLP